MPACVDARPLLGFCNSHSIYLEERVLRELEAIVRPIVELRDVGVSDEE